MDAYGIESARSLSPVCFVNPDSINVTPYFHVYEDCINCDYDLIYWSRSGTDECVSAVHTYRYKRAVAGNGTVPWLWSLLAGYLGFRRYAKRILEQNDYQAVVLLTGNSGVLLWDVLTKKYDKRYIVDIRDYFLERIPLYRRIEEKVIDKAKVAIISSPAYTAFLGEHDFKVLHNVQKIDYEKWKRMRGAKSCGLPFVLVSIGTAKNLDQDRRVIDYFANDDRFEVRFAGRGYDALRQYCRDRGVRNVRVGGEFSSCETLGFYQDADAILSMYGAEKAHVKYQLTNKLYYALQLDLPIVVSPGTFMAETVGQYELGLALDTNDQSQKEKILNLCAADQVERRLHGAERFLKRISADNRAALESIKSALSF